MTILLSYVILCHSGFFFFSVVLLQLDSVVLLGFLNLLKKKKEKAIQMNEFLHI